MLILAFVGLLRTSKVLDVRRRGARSEAYGAIGLRTCPCESRDNTLLVRGGGFYLTFCKARGNVKNSAENQSRTFHKIEGAILFLV
jgi:hypothetical protein